MADNLRVYKEYLRLHLKTAMEYRTNFFVQSLFMLLSDGLWLIVWYYLFKEFGTINGYAAPDVLLVYGIGVLGFGLIFTFVGNVNNLSTHVENGNFDFFLTKPVDELFHSLMSRMMYSAVGDIAFGIMLLAIMATDKLLFALAASILGAVVLLSFEIMIDTVSFFVERPKKITQTMHRVIVGFGIWPIDTFTPRARALLYALMLAFIATVPRNAIAEASWALLGFLAIVAGTLLTASIIIFKFGVRRYESGNMMTVRT